MKLSSAPPILEHGGGEGVWRLMAIDILNFHIYFEYMPYS